MIISGKGIVRIILCYILVCSGQNAAAQEIQEIEFRNQRLPDVLMSLGQVAGVSILTDNTVTGNVTYRFTDTTFPQAMELLASQYGFFWTKDDSGVYHVSKIQASYDSETNLINFKANQADIHSILQSLSKTIGKTVLFDPLPSEPLTLNSTGITPEKLMEIILARFPNYEFSKDKDYFYVKRKPPETPGRQPRDAGVKKTGDDSYSINLDRGELVTVLNSLFRMGGKEYVFLYKSNSVLQNLHYSGKSFDEILRLILEQSSGGFSVTGGMYYIYELNRQDILKSYKTTVYIPLKYLAAEEIPALLPAAFSSNSFYKLDSLRNGIILSGSLEEISPVRDYITSIDRPASGKKYYRYVTSYVDVSKLLELIPKRLLTPKPMIFADSGTFVALLSPEQKADLDQLLEKIDQPEESMVLNLKYIKAEDFLKNVPPPFKTEDFSASGSDSVLYFKGTEERFELLKKKLAQVDKPKPQLRYKLLILQTQEGTGTDWEFNVSNSLTEDTDKTAFLGSLGNLMSMDFDLVSTFGYLFALKVSASLDQTASKVLADTTLHGISGETVKFQNTSTYRYADTEVDDNGNIVTTGTTTEISTGLIMNITGWVSGDGMITMEVESTLSKTGASSSATGTLPPTSERVVNTHVRTPSGKPIIIGGLKQQEKTVTRKSVPLLGSIPLLRLLFRSNVASIQNTDLAIYIIPFIEENTPAGTTPETEIKSLYERFAGKPEQQ